MPQWRRDQGVWRALTRPDVPFQAWVRDPAARTPVVSDLLARPYKIRGRGECWAPAAPAASCAVKKAHALETTGSPGRPAFPAQWFYRLSSCSCVRKCRIGGRYRKRARMAAMGGSAGGNRVGIHSQEAFRQRVVNAFTADET